MRTNHWTMWHKVITNTSIEVTQDDDHVSRWNREHGILEQVVEVIRLHTGFCIGRDRVGGGIDNDNWGIWQMSVEMNMDNALKAGMENTTSSLPRGTSTQTQSIATPWTWLEGDPEWRMGVEQILVMPSPVQWDSERARSSIFFSFMVLVAATSCAFWSPRVLRVLTFQHAILFFDLACKCLTSWF